MVMKKLRIILLSIFISITLCAQGINELVLNREHHNPVDVTYKIINGDTLKLTLIYPQNFKNSKKYPTIIFFFGGGWNGGSISQFEPQAKYFSSRGMISVLADYRVKSRNGTTPFEAVSDAKSAIRFLRQNARQLNVNPNKIVASGGSAGGDLAAATGNLPGLDEPGEDINISSKANVLVLFNPVFDNGPDGFEHERMGKRWMEISPAHNIKRGAPPTIIFLGTKDNLIPVPTAEKYKMKMEEVGSRCELHLYEGQNHGFFNQQKDNHEYYDKTVHDADLFLQSLKYLKHFKL